MKFSSDKLKFANSIETKKIFADFPDLKELHINYDFNVDRHFQATDKFVDHNDFYSWLIRLLNKLNDIRFSYVQLAYSFGKGIPDENWKKDMEDGGTILFEDFISEEHQVNKFLFDFFTEAFYYHYFSSIDLLYKTINKFYSINIREDSNRFNVQVLENLKRKDFQFYTIIEIFNKSISPNRKLRNDFAHNYAVNEIDLRSKQTIKDGKRSATLMDPSYTTSNQLYPAIQKLVKEYVPVLKLFEITLKKGEEELLSKQ